MEVTREDVLRCAKLASLQLDETEIEPMRLAMARMLSHAESLDALPLEGVEPTTHGLNLILPRREDEVLECFTQAQALANAPEHDQGHFVVPKVMPG
ncbi:MAG: Asp-tRNA(Asn)/Glu-tRNA(Gln) amidotransferase subunit GatC [Holophagaceae bacterium]|nr:Asp-tRNA(Asn)/Glu-tRNA(Gln) amidotransferase subunit GatC [Holophagaceae bacterium]